MLAVFLGFLGYSVLNISQAIQKIGLDLRPKQKAKGLAIWVGGTAGTVLATFIVFAAVSTGGASLVAATAGTGLASLAVFSFFVLKEEIGVKKIIGISILVLACGAVGYFSSQPNPQAEINLPFLLIALLASSTLFSLLWFFVRSWVKGQGLVIGSFAGALGGFVLLFQKVASSALGRSLSLINIAHQDDSADKGDLLVQALAMFTNPFSLGWILLSLASMAVLQFAYRRDEITRIIPFFTASLIVVPVLGGVFCLAESISLMQWLALGFVLLGLFLLTWQGKKA